MLAPAFGFRMAMASPEAAGPVSDLLQPDAAHESRMAMPAATIPKRRESDSG
jgi:hypothetical protein